MFKKGFLTLIIAISTFSWSMAQVKLNEIVWDKTVHEFGELEFDAPEFKIAFSFTNKSANDFVINRVLTTCNCTDAKWPQTIIKPGGKGVVTVTFRPAGLAGDILKELKVFANYSDAQFYILNIEGKIKHPELLVDQQTMTNPVNYYGYLRFSKYQLFYGTIKNNSKATQSFMVVNDHSSPISIGEIKSPKPFITVSANEMEVDPGDTGTINVTIDATMINDFGELSDEIHLHTGDLLYPVKTVELYYNVQYAFKDSKRALRKAPKVYLDKKKVDLGNMNEGGKKKGTVTITNKGKKDLLLLKMETHCSCTVINSYPDRLKKDESAVLTIEFDALFKKGRQNKVITIYTNDPLNSKVDITVSANVISHE